MQQFMDWEEPFEYHFDRGLYYHEVAPRLFCGTQIRNKEELFVLREVEHVGSIINLQQDKDGDYWGVSIPGIKAAAEEQGIKYFRMPVVDFSGASLRPQLPRIVAIINRELSKQRKVYIHCTAGLGRAPGACIAYLYWLHGLSLDKAYQHVTAIRPCAPSWEAIRGATYDLVKGPPPEGLDRLKKSAFENISAAEREHIKHHLHDMIH